jgi:transposase
MTDEGLGVATEYQISDELWERIEPLLPSPKPKKKSGRPRMDDRKAITAIFYVHRTGGQWKALPVHWALPAPSTTAFRSGAMQVCSCGCGELAYRSMTNWKGWTGNDRRWTAR